MTFSTSSSSHLHLPEHRDLPDLQLKRINLYGTKLAYRIFRNGFINIDVAFLCPGTDGAVSARNHNKQKWNVQLRAFRRAHRVPSWSSSDGSSLICVCVPTNYVRACVGRTWSSPGPPHRLHPQNIKLSSFINMPEEWPLSSIALMEDLHIMMRITQLGFGNIFFQSSLAFLTYIMYISL